MGGDFLKNSLFVFDWATCNNYFEWFFEDNKTDNACRALYDTHVFSAIAKTKYGKPTIIIGDSAAEKLVRDYGLERSLVIDTFLEAVEVKQILDGMSEMQSLVKIHGLSDVTRKTVYIIASDKFVYNQLKSERYNVINLSELSKLINP